MGRKFDRRRRNRLRPDMAGHRQQAAGDGRDPASAGRLFAEARETGRVRHLACSASVVGRRLDREALGRRVDEIVGWPTAIALIRAAEKSFVW